MKFVAPAKHQKKYVLGAFAVLLVSLVFVAKNGPIHKNSVPDSGTRKTGIIPTAATSSAKIATSANPLIKPLPTAAVKSSAATPSAPSDTITATSYLVGNVATGQIYLSKNITASNGLASISKLFTAIIAEENMDPNEEIQITPAMLAVYPNSYGVMLGEKFTLSQLLYAMLLQSNDNVAEGIAMAYSSPNTYITAPEGTFPSEDAFVQKMNELSASLGLTQTHFEDASGLVDGNVTDAQDLFSFARYLYRSQPDLLAITRTYSYSVATTTNNLGHDFINIDPFVGDPHYIGGKTGRTDDAGETMLSIFDYQSKGVDYPVVVIVLHSDLSQRQNDSSQLYLRAMSIIDKQSS